MLPRIRRGSIDAHHLIGSIVARGQHVHFSAGGLNDHVVRFGKIVLVPFESYGGEINGQTLVDLSVSV